MLCQDYPTALPLLLCTEPDARIYVGITTTPVTYVMVYSLATKRHTRYDAMMDSDGWYFEPDGEVIVGLVYLVRLFNEQAPVDFYPYVVSGYSIIPSTTINDGVFVTFDKMYVDGVSYLGYDQFLTLE